MFWMEKIKIINLVVMSKIDGLEIVCKYTHWLDCCIMYKQARDLFKAELIEI